MNCLVTCDRFQEDCPGGGFKIAWELARLLRDRGHHVSMLCGSTDADPPAGPSDVQGVRVVRYRFPTAHVLDPRRMSLHVEAAAARARAHLADRPWHVIHAHMLGGGLAAFRDLGRGARRLATVHSPTVLEQRINWSDGSFAGRVKRVLGEPLLRRYEWRWLRAADAIHALSRYTISEIGAMHGPALASRMTCIPWWSDVDGGGPSRAEARQRLGWDPDVPTAFTLRRMVRRMGLGVLVDAAARLARDGSRFRVVLGGDGPDRSALEAIAAAGPASGHVAFAGRLTDEQVDLAYRAADLFVLPTLTLECFGIITLEAFARGCPVIASRVGAIPEMVEPLLPGALFEPGDAGALARRMGEALSGATAFPPAADLQAYAAARYGRARIAERYLAWIEDRPAVDPTPDLPQPDDAAAWARHLHGRTGVGG